MTKKAKILTIIFSVLGACVLAGGGVFSYLYFSKKTNNRSTTITPTPPDPVIIIEPVDTEGYEQFTDDVIASNYDMAEVYQGFYQIGWKIMRAKSTAVQNGNLIIPQVYQKLPVISISDTFSNWSEIERIVIPNTLKYIETDNNKGCFRNCTSIQTIQFPVGTKITNVGENAFYNCKLLEGIDLSSCEIIEKSAFDGCEKIVGIDLSSCKQIGVGAFYNCKALKDVTFGEALERISDDAFCYTVIEEISLPSYDFTLGRNPFAHTNLTSIVLENGSSNYEIAQGCIVTTSNAKRTLVVGSKNGGIEDGVVVVGENAFAGINAGNLIIPSSVEKIEKAAFKSHENLVQLNSGLKIIGEEAFSDSLVAFEALPDTVTELGTNAFAGCQNLGENFEAKGVTKVGIAVFAGTPVQNLTLKGGSSFVAETDSDGHNFLNGSIIQNVTYLEPIETE